MYIRSKLQQRALDNLSLITQRMYSKQRVTKGYVLSSLVHNFANYISDEEILQSAISESDVKQEGSGIAVNFNITAQANAELNSMKTILDKKTGRSLFPAQVIDILLICAVRTSFTDTATDNCKNLDALRLELIKLIATTSNISILQKVRCVLKGNDSNVL